MLEATALPTKPPPTTVPTLAFWFMSDENSNVVEIA